MWIKILLGGCANFKMKLGKFLLALSRSADFYGISAAICVKSQIGMSSNVTYLETFE